jgi:hypothetical protein
LLFHLFANHSDSHWYGGGVIRLESTNSQWLQTIYPAELTHILEPNIVVPLLEKIGNPSPMYFNPGANRVLGLIERGWVEHSGNFFQYTVPAIEFKRLLKEAKRKDHNFTVSFAQLPGTSGDETWRAFAVQRRFQVSFIDGEIAVCNVEMFENGISTLSKMANCKKSDLPYQLHVPWLIQKIAMYHPYPIIFDKNQTMPRKTITCFGP